MTKKNPFDDEMQKKAFAKSELSQKQNPLTSMENLEPVHTKYKSVRVDPKVHEFFSDYAHQNRISILEAIGIAKELLEKHDPID